MKQKVSDYIADYIANWGIRDVFTVTGGGAMHMNDAFGHHPKLHLPAPRTGMCDGSRSICTYG